MIKFEWDVKKNILNQQKHDIRFEEAIQIFDGEFETIFNDYVGGEERWLSIGWTNRGVLLFVIHTIQENGTEIFRLISARKPDRTERNNHGYR